MKRAIEEILDSAIEQLAAGKTVEAVLAQYPEHAEELSGILAMVQPALSLPKNEIPQPVRRRRYVQALHVPWQERLQKMVRLALIPATAVFIFAGSTQLVVSAQASLPGDSLYRVKLAAERARVAVTIDPVEKAHLELSYSQKRLADTQAVLALKDSSPGRQAVALTKLKEQTEKTFALVPTVAANSALNNNDDTLFKGLIAVNNQQKDLLKALPAKDETKELATTALEVTENHGKAITALLAAVNEEILVSMVYRDTSVTGTVQAVYNEKRTITIDNVSYAIGEYTQIKNGDKDLALAGLTVNSKVTVTASKVNGIMTADRIEVLALSPVPVKPGEVKGVSTKPAEQAAPPATEPTAPPTANPTPTTANPNTVTGGYIAEQPE